MDHNILSIIFSVPIVAIVLGIGSSMLKTYLKHQERMVDKRINAQGEVSDDIRLQMADLQAEIARLRETTTQYDLSIDHTLGELEHRLNTVENRKGQYVTPAVEEPQAQTVGISTQAGG